MLLMNTTVFATPPWGPIIRRSRSRVLCESGSQICGSLVMGKLLRWGSGPDHFTVPLMIPPFATDTTWYPLLWPVALPTPVNSIPTEIATAAARNILTHFGAMVIAALKEEQVTKVIARGPLSKSADGDDVPRDVVKLRFGRRAGSPSQRGLQPVTLAPAVRPSCGLTAGAACPCTSTPRVW